MVNFLARAVEDFVEHFKLGVANIFRGEFWPLSPVVDLRVGYSGTKRGFDSYHAP